MDFKIDGRSLCLDVREDEPEQIEAVISVIVKACDHLERRGYVVNIKLDSKEIYRSEPA